MANTSLHQAKKAKQDEFYTQYDDISKEVYEYAGRRGGGSTNYFEDQVVFLNCDDPEWSNFWQYFYDNFDDLKLARLISTHYDTQEPTYKMIVDRDGERDDDGRIIPVTTPLKGNGDFRSGECIDLLDESDIVVTNPPFSLFREYLAQLIEHEKKFLIIGNQNCITYKEVFPLLKDNVMWLGVNNGPMEFEVPSSYSKIRRVDDNDPDNPKYYAKLGNICWFTNLDHKRRHSPIPLGKRYDPQDYPPYDNYDAIEVSRVVDIPVDYEPGYLVPVAYRKELEEEGFILGHERKNASGEMCVCVCGRRHDTAPCADGGVGVVQRRDGSSDNVHGQAQSGAVRDSEVQEGHGREGSRCEWEAALLSYLDTAEPLEYCSGVMGVPITYPSQHCPEQFEIVNANDYRRTDDVRCKPHGLIKDAEATITERERESQNDVCENLHPEGCCRRVLTDGMSTGSANTHASLSASYLDMVARPVIGTRRVYRRMFVRKKTEL